MTVYLPFGPQEVPKGKEYCCVEGALVKMFILVPELKLTLRKTHNFGGNRLAIYIPQRFVPRVKEVINDLDSYFVGVRILHEQ